MTEQALQTFKSDFAREIFKNDLYHTYQDMTAHRDELRRTGRDKIAQIVQQINNSAYENETVVLMLKELSATLENYKGKMVYGYMPKTAKNLINGIIDELAKLDYEINRDLVQSKLCQTCLDSINDLWFGDYPPAELAVVSLKERKIHGMVDTCPWFSVGEFGVDCEYKENGDIDLLIHYIAPRYK